MFLFFYFHIKFEILKVNLNSDKLSKLVLNDLSRDFVKLDFLSLSSNEFVQFNIRIHFKIANIIFFFKKNESKSLFVDRMQGYHNLLQGKSVFS